MKRLIALLLALVLALSLVACAEEEEPTSRRRRKTKETTTEVTEEPTEETQEETTEEPTEEETEPEEDETPYGVCNGRVYENTYFGFGVLLDNSWVIATPEETARLMGIGAEAMGLEDLPQMPLYDFFAMNGSGESVNVTIQPESIFTRVYDDTEFMEASADATAAQLEGVGAEDVQTEIIELEFAGRKCAAMSIFYNLQGMELHQTLLLWRGEDHMALIAVSVKDAENAADIMRCFYEIQ